MKQQHNPITIDERIKNSVHLAAQKAAMHNTSLIFADGDDIVELSPQTTPNPYKPLDQWEKISVEKNK